MITFIKFVEVNYKKDEQYIKEIIDRVKYDNDFQAHIEYGRWVDAYYEALRYGDN